MLCKLYSDSYTSMVSLRGVQFLLFVPKTSRLISAERGFVSPKGLRQLAIRDESSTSSGNAGPSSHASRRPTRSTLRELGVHVALQDRASDGAFDRVHYREF